MLIDYNSNNKIHIIIARKELIYLKAYDKSILEKHLILRDITNLDIALTDITTLDEFKMFKFSRKLSSEQLKIVLVLKDKLNKFMNDDENLIVSQCNNSDNVNEQIFETEIEYLEDFFVCYLISLRKSLRYIKENNIQPVSVNVNDAMAFSTYIETKPINKDNENNFNLEKPIIIISNPFLNPPFMISDGNHRVKKAYQNGVKSIPAYIIGYKSLANLCLGEKLYYLISIIIKYIDVTLFYRTGQGEEIEYLKLLQILNTAINKL